MEHIQLYTKISQLPGDLKTEVNDFIDFLLSKKKKKNQRKQPQFGCTKGEIITSPDFDEPMEDMKEYMQ
jgi:hypothetical protein